MSCPPQRKEDQVLITSQFNAKDDLKAKYDAQLSLLMKDQVSLNTPFPFEQLAADVLKAKSPLLYGDNVDLKRQEIRKYFHDTFTTFERLHEVLLNDDIFYYQPERLRHPLVFYFGHTAVFFLNKLNIAGIIKKRLDPSIESMCAIGVDEMSWDDLNPSHYNWSTISRLREYRNEVRAMVDNLILTLPLALPINWESPMWIILMGIEHERIHLETSSVLFRQLPPHCVKQAELYKLFPFSATPQVTAEMNSASKNAANNQLQTTSQSIINKVDITTETEFILPEMPSLEDIHTVHNAANKGYVVYSEELRSIANDPKSRSLTTKTIPSRTVTFGKSYQHHLYGWDNEYGGENQQVPEFTVSTKLISNRQFLGFILKGGYHNPKFWSEEGWRFAQYKTGILKQEWPHFWQPIADELVGVEYPTPTQAILEEASVKKLQEIEASQKRLEQQQQQQQQNATSASAPSNVSNNNSNNNNSDSDNGSVVMSDNDDDCVMVNKKFNSTMRVHPRQLPNKLTITGYQYRWLAGLVEMPWDWPVDLNNLESQAYARFVHAELYGEDSLSSFSAPASPTTPSGENSSRSEESSLLPQQPMCRLPTEFEFRSMQLHILSTYGQLSQSLPVQTDTTQSFDYTHYDFPVADLANAVSPQNISLQYASSSPVDYHQYFNSGFYDVVGNVWQHCCSVIYPLRDFQVHNAYDDFTVPTFDNMHGLIFGGSWISTGNEACYNARYAFRRHFYQHAGARVGFFTNKPKTGEELQSIEQDTAIANRLHADFYDLLTNTDLIKCETPNTKALLCSRDVNSKQTADLIKRVVDKLKRESVLSEGFTPKNILVLGCRGGRLPLELAVLYPQSPLVQGIDTTTRLLGAGLRMMNGSKISYLLKTSYQQTNYVCVREEALNNYFKTKHNIADPQEAIYNRVDLMQTDICNLPEDKVGYNKYNMVVVDCLDTAYNPKLLLQNINRHLISSCPTTTQQSIVALNIYHQWEQDNKDNCAEIWGYRDETNGEFVDVECGIAHIVPHTWKLVTRCDYNQRIRRINERVYSLYDMTTYFYAVAPVGKRV